DRQGCQGGHVPFDPEVVRRDARGERRNGEAGRYVRSTTSIDTVDTDAASPQVFNDHFAEPVVSETRYERHRNIQPRQTERDVSRATARMGDERLTSALADQVDKRLPDDNEHAHHHPDRAPQRRYN